MTILCTSDVPSKLSNHGAPCARTGPLRGPDQGVEGYPIKWRAMTILWTSLVPSKISNTLMSRM